MANDWLTYVTPKPKPAKDGSMPNFDPGASYEAPLFYPSGSKYMWNNVRRGDRIWMLGAPRIGGRMLPIGVDGMLVVKAAHKSSDRSSPAGPGTQVSDRAYWYEADTGSQWFPWRDATGLISNCALVTKDGIEWKLPGIQTTGEKDGTGWWRTWGNRIRPGSKLKPSAKRKIERHVSPLKTKSVFISYAWADGAPLAARLSEFLSARYYGVWLDRFSGPRRLADGLAVAEEGSLGPFLDKALQSCAAFAQIRTPGARRGESGDEPESWCIRELEVARCMEKPGARVEVNLEGCRTLRKFTDTHERALKNLTRNVLAELSGNE